MRWIFDIFVLFVFLKNKKTRNTYTHTHTRVTTYPHARGGDTAIGGLERDASGLAELNARGADGRAAALWGDGRLDGSGSGGDCSHFGENQR